MVPRRKTKVSPPPDLCPLRTCMAKLGGAWTPNIIWYLGAGARRFTELKADLGTVSAKVLTARLRRMEAQGIVRREVLPTSPPTVEYSLTDLGRELQPAIAAIVAVGNRLKTRER